MLPTGATANQRTAINRNFADLDSLLSELNEPKEQIISTQPGQLSQPSPLSNGSQPPGEQYPDQPTEQISPEVAALSGKMIAGTIDTVAGTGLGLYAHNSTNPEKYQANDKQLVQLEQAATAIALKYNYKVEDSPWFNFLILVVAIYLPKWQEAKKDKRFAEMDERLQELERQAKAAEARLNQLQSQTEQKAA